LARLIEALPADTRHALAVLSLCDVPLKRGELSEALSAALNVPAAAVAAHFRRLRTAGVLEVFGNDRLKVHDAVRLSGRVQFAALGANAAAAHRSLRDVLQRSVQAEWEYPKLKLFLRMLAETGEVKTLVDLGGDELFHELGLWPEIEAWLKAAAASATVPPETRFWALDAIVFNLMRTGSAEARARIEDMKELAEAYDFGPEERLAVSMKEMLLLAREGREDEAMRVMDATAAALNPSPAHQRIFRYNAAAAMFRLGHAERAADEAMSIADEYFEVLGVTPLDVLGRSSPELRALLKPSDNIADDCKHLADCLDLHAMAANAAGRDSHLARIHAMKFYELAQSPESLVRVGQDLVDEFIGRRDFEGARQILEEELLPILQKLKLAGYVVPVRAQYAVTLAYCGAFDAAEAEMARLQPYEKALAPSARAELANQRGLVAALRRHGPPPQWFEPGGRPALLPSVPPPRMAAKVGRNEPCPCGSGSKYKKCHGSDSIRPR
jgi:hypothetical protein